MMPQGLNMRTCHLSQQTIKPDKIATAQLAYSLDSSWKRFMSDILSDILSNAVMTRINL